MKSQFARVTITMHEGVNLIDQQFTNGHDTAVGCHVTSWMTWWWRDILDTCMARHYHCGCTSFAGSGCLVHLLGGVWYIGCIGIYGCMLYSFWWWPYVGWRPMYEGMVVTSIAFVFKTLLNLSSVDTISTWVAKSGILCWAMVGIPSMLVFLVVVPTN